MRLTHALNCVDFVVHRARRGAGRHCRRGAGRSGGDGRRGHPSGDGVRRAGESRSDRAGRPDHVGGEGDARRSRLLRRQGLHQSGDPVRGAIAAGDLARRLPAAGLRRVLRPRRSEICRTRRGPAATRRPTLRWRTARSSLRQTTRATRPPATAMCCGEDRPELRFVFGYTSEHQLARAAKALMRTFYGRDPSYSYFSGVSDGGHEALVLAQRYPEDFNGILAGARANNWAPLLACSSRGSPRRTATRKANRS